MIAANCLSDITDLDKLVNLIDHHPRLFVLTGAGCSTESGIPDYRDINGEWKHKKPMQYQDFIHGSDARQRYWARSMLGWSRIANAQPNSAHRALAHLEQVGLIHQLVTQNVDGLHQKAGSRRVIDLHGRLDTVDCLECRGRLSRMAFQEILQSLNPDFQDYIAINAAPDGDVQLEDVNFSRFQIPSCQRCGGILKPSVVFYGEVVPRSRIELSLKRLETAAALLIVGSSLMVFSGYRFVRAALAQHKPVAAVNLGRTRADDQLTLKISAPCGQTLSSLESHFSVHKPY